MPSTRRDLNAEGNGTCVPQLRNYCRRSGPEQASKHAQSSCLHTCMHGTVLYCGCLVPQPPAMQQCCSAMQTGHHAARHTSKGVKGHRPSSWQGCVWGGGEGESSGSMVHVWQPLAGGRPTAHKKAYPTSCQRRNRRAGAERGEAGPTIQQGVSAKATTATAGEA